MFQSSPELLAKTSTVHLQSPPTCGVQDTLLVAKTPALVTVVDQSSIPPPRFFWARFPGVKDVLRLVSLVFTPELVTMLPTSTATSGLLCKYEANDRAEGVRY